MARTWFSWKAKDLIIAGVGTEQIFGRDLANQHRIACTKAGILYYGMNAEVMAGQWEYQIGYRGVEGEDAGALNAADHTWLCPLANTSFE